MLQKFRELFHYCPETGDLTWKMVGPGRRVGDRVGAIYKDRRHRMVRIDGRRYRVPTVAYCMGHGCEYDQATGDMSVVSVDGDLDNLRLSNLELVTVAEIHARARRRRTGPEYDFRVPRYVQRPGLSSGLPRGVRLHPDYPGRYQLYLNQDGFRYAPAQPEDGYATPEEAGAMAVGHWEDNYTPKDDLDLGGPVRDVHAPNPRYNRKLMDLLISIYAPRTPRYRWEIPRHR